MNTLHLLAIVLAAVDKLGTQAATLGRAAVDKSCYYLPGDVEWPSDHEWSQLNSSIGGRLLATVPIARVCHGADFNSETCSSVQNTYKSVFPHMEDPFSIMVPYWLNNSCSPFTSLNSSCTIGNLVSYTINVTRAEDVAAGLQFAQEKNIRVAVKNTGHDFRGRSTGQGALGLWMHNMKNITFFNYTSPVYQGPAVRMQAGVQAFDATSAANRTGQRLISGFCPTVGIAGGYTQGGGHGPLSSQYGLAADNSLEFEVVTSEGRHLVASKEQNADLFWALNGGGAGTYAVVLSVVARTFPDGPVAGAALSLNNTEPELFWEAVAAWQAQLPALNDLPGFQSVFTVTNASFAVNFATWLGHGEADVRAALAPFADSLRARNLSFELETSGDLGYYPHFARYTAGLPYGNYNISEVLGGRLIPRSVAESRPGALAAAIRNIVSDGRYTFNGIAMNVSHARVGNRASDNAVLPAWRDALYSANTVAVWEPSSPLSELQALQRETNEAVIPQLERLTPGSGTYSNEGTFDLPTWKDDYYGANYEKLVEIKRKYDPGMLFYGRGNVGSDYWTQAADGRLCRSFD